MSLLTKSQTTTINRFQPGSLDITVKMAQCDYMSILTQWQRGFIKYFPSL